MNEAFFAEQLQAVRYAFAEGMGCTDEAFSNERQLTIVDRPANAPWPWVALITTFGTGTALSVDPEYRAFAEERAPAKHYRAMYPVLMDALVEEGARRGARLDYQVPGLGFALCEEPSMMAAAPEGLALRFMDQPWMAAQVATNRFHNAVGEANADAREFRNQFAAVLFDGDEPAAVAGVFRTFGMLEIGLDVRGEYRRRGLAKIVVNAATREILDRGKTPFYTCAATNINSHRTAEACGFAIACSDAFVSPLRPDP